MSIKHFNEIEISTRNLETNSSLKKIRSEGLFPAVIYGKDLPKSIHVSGKSKELSALINKDKSFMQRVFKLNDKSNKKSYDALIKEIVFHPVKETIDHIDFLHLQTQNDIVKLDVPFRVYNSDKCDGLKKGGFISMRIYSEKVRGPVKNIPEALDVNIEGLKIGEAVRSDQIKLPEGFSFVKKSKFLVLSIEGKRVEEESTKTEAPAK